MVKVFNKKYESVLHGPLKQGWCMWYRIQALAGSI